MLHSVHHTTMHQCHFIQSRIRKVHECLAVTCHLHFQQTDQDVFSHATAVTWERNRYQIKSQHRKLTGEENYPTTFARTGTCDILITSPALYTRAIPVRLWLTWKTSVRVLLLLLCFLDLLFIFVSVMMTNSNNFLFKFFFIVQFPHLLRVSTTCHSVAVRWKKKPPKWRHPADISWAAPLLEKLKQREQSSGNDAERPPAMLHMVTRVRQLGGRP